MVRYFGCVEDQHEVGRSRYYPENNEFDASELREVIARQNRELWSCVFCKQTCLEAGECPNILSPVRASKVEYDTGSLCAGDAREHTFANSSLLRRKKSVAMISLALEHIRETSSAEALSA